MHAGKKKKKKEKKEQNEGRTKMGQLSSICVDATEPNRDRCSVHFHRDVAELT